MRGCYLEVLGELQLEWLKKLCFCYANVSEVWELHDKYDKCDEQVAGIITAMENDLLRIND